MGLKLFYQTVTLLIVKFLNPTELSLESAIAPLRWFGFPPLREVTTKGMELEKLGFWLNDWGKIDKKHRERRN